MITCDHSNDAFSGDITTMGALDTDPAAQARMIEDAIAKKPDTIIVVPNDTATVEPLMKKGMEAGIMMLTQEAPSIENAVADIEFLIREKEGKDMMALLVKNIGDSSEYAIMVGGLTVEGHNKRADAMVAYQEANFPNLKQATSRVEGGVGYGLSILTVIWFVIALCAGFILYKTKVGRRLYAMGGNLEAARRVGIDILRYRLLPMVFSVLRRAWVACPHLCDPDRGP